MSSLTKKHLSLVSQGEELKGQAPPLFEQIARVCVVGSPDHRGIVTIATTLSRGCIASTVPPSAQETLMMGIHSAQLWLRGQAQESDVKLARVKCFQALNAIESLTVEAVVKAQKQLPHESTTLLDPHADHVVKRYASLAAHFCVSAVCHSLDAIEKPDSALDVLQDIEGARAYLGAGLGAARHPAFRAAALHQAKWENERSRTAAKSKETAASLAIQVFHEYLGGRWRSHSDAERINNAVFVKWAFGGRHPHSH